MFYVAARRSVVGDVGADRGEQAVGHACEEARAQSVELIEEVGLCKGHI